MRAYFFSDVHLGLGTRVEEKEKENSLLTFLRSILRKTDALYVLGDLFDFWFEYGTVIPKGFHRTLAALQEFTDHGVPVHYLAGNHDFWMDDFFSAEIGMTVHFDPFETTIDGQRVFLHHGDGLARNDAGYRFIKPILRSRVSIALYRWLHPDIGVRIARGSSRTSRAYTAGKRYDDDEGMIRFAAEKIGQGASIVVMGHRHRPTLRPVGNGTYVNLGDWISYRTYGEMHNGVMALKTWNGIEE